MSQRCVREVEAYESGNVGAWGGIADQEMGRMEQKRKEARD